MTFVSAFSYQQQYAPSASALFFPDWHNEPVCYADLNRITLNIYSRMAKAGVRRGDVVSFDIKNELLHGLFLIACARHGIVTVSGHPEHVRHKTVVKAHYCDHAARAEGTTVVVVDAKWIDSTQAEDATSPWAEPAPDDLCRIMLTSGSTGNPKAIALSYRMVQERINSFLFTFGGDFPSYARIMCGMRLSSSLGFAFLFYTLARGGLFCADSVDFDKITGAIKKLDIGVMITTPYTLAELVSYCAASGSRFERMPLILTAGSVISTELVQQVRRALSDRLVIFYGTTETGVISACWWDAGPGAVGLVVPGRHVDVTDAAGAIVPKGASGSVRIRASSGLLPFYDLAESEARKSPEFFCPGDVASFDARGHLVIHGREDNVINIGGTKTTPESLEQILLAAPGVQDCAIALSRDELGIDRIVAFLVPRPIWNQGSFLEYCEARIMRDLLPSKFVMIQKVPRNQNMKIDRAALAKLA